MGIQRHYTKTFTEMTGPNKEYVAYRAGAENQNSAITREFEKRGR